MSGDKSCACQVGFYRSSIKQDSCFFLIHKNDSFKGMVSYARARAPSSNFGCIIAFEFQGIDVNLFLLAMLFRLVGCCFLRGWCFSLSFVIVMESTIIATVYCPDIGYCLFGESPSKCTFLTMYPVSSILLYFYIGSYFPQFGYKYPSLLVPIWDTICFLLCITGLVPQ